MSKLGPVDLGTIDIWNQITFYVCACPVHCKMFGSVPGPPPLEANSIHTHTHTHSPVVTINNVFRCCQMSPMDQNGTGQHRAEHWQCIPELNGNSSCCYPELESPPRQFYSKINIQYHRIHF